jgi:hypothetical protein
MGWVLSTLTYGEFVRLVISLSIDLIEYIIPILLLPIIGTLYAIVGLSTSLYLYGWIGLIAALDLLPGLNILPMNTVTWVAWLFVKRQREVTERLLGEA